MTKRRSIGPFHAQPPSTSDQAIGASTRLTKRERQVAALIAEGLTKSGHRCPPGDPFRTAQGHVEHILTKLGITSRTQVAAWVVDRTHD
ncbi:putative LuxR family transcriptional regulator [Rhodococcus opacus B4]|uniref:Putative LuxR family transcriptional regulator n=1 Tax=Rhodococcus opacus (strain B4) TaxID=632772 RepID=C1B5C2_RHOOB|nr:helix-turn-helix transcriptional regulator [Rhodococcus opacus]BAH51048.1 putative LuxR family transcriptional regulator [Rhodococcus opacus B4]